MAFLTLLALSACQSRTDPGPRRSLAMMTSLPLFWGEGDIAAVLDGEDQRAPVFRILSSHHDLVPVDALDPVQLAKADLMILAQPRLLSPQELVDLDGWVRAGGRALILADPELHWPSSLPLGDQRRPPPVTLLDPLFAHWGISLATSLEKEAEVALGHHTVASHTVGRWRSLDTACAVDRQGYIAECALGKGHATLVGDADFLEAANNGDALLHLVRVASD